MKKTICVFLAFALMLSLVACGGGNSSNEKLEFEQLEWPTYENAKQIPVPNSTLADVRNSNDVRFEFYLANTTFEDYKAYVEECKERGFFVDPIEQENRYYAFNEANYELTVQYQEGDIMYVCVVEDRYDIEIKLLHTDKTSANMYNLRVEIDGYWEEDSEQGDEAISFDAYLKEGEHTLIVENDDDDDINGRIDFIASEDGEYLEFEINCLSNKIEITPIGSTSIDGEDSNNEESSNSTDIPTTSNTNVATESEEEETETYVNDGVFSITAYSFANDFEDAFDGINGHTFKTEAEVDDSKSFYDADNYVYYRILDDDNYDRDVGMISFTKPNGKTLLVSEEFTADCWSGINILIEGADDVSATVVASVLAIDPGIGYNDAFDVAQDIVDNISIYNGDASELQSVECNGIKYTLYKDNKYHYFLVTALK